MDRAPAPALCLFLVEMITVFDNLVVSLGNRLGIGSVAERLNWARFLFHGTFIAFLLPVYWYFAEMQEVSFFHSGVSTLILVLLMMTISGLGFYIGFLRIPRIMPIDYFGCLRYAQAVSEQTRYRDYAYSNAELSARPMPPLAPIITVLIGLAVSAWIGLAAGDWLPLVLTLIMFLAASFPPRTWGPLATSWVEVIFSGGLLYVLFRVT